MYFPLDSLAGLPPSPHCLLPNRRRMNVASTFCDNIGSTTSDPMIHHCFAIQKSSTSRHSKLSRHSCWHWRRLFFLSSHLHWYRSNFESPNPHVGVVTTKPFNTVTAVAVPLFIHSIMPVSTRGLSKLALPNSCKTTSEVARPTITATRVVTPEVVRYVTRVHVSRRSSTTNGSDDISTKRVLNDESLNQQDEKKRKVKVQMSFELSDGIVDSKVSMTPTAKKKTKTSGVSSPELKEVVAVDVSRAKTVSIIQPPKDWMDIYCLVEELRQDRTAPCDHSGCEALPDTSADPVTKRFQVLVCLMLSSQTKDAVVASAIRSLQSDHVLNIHDINKMESSVLQQYINKVGFHNNKTKYIKDTTKILLERYNGDIPRTAKEMIRDLPGVGPKMAYIIESVAWDTQSGIGVDTHMHRLFNMLRWVHNTSTPEKTRIQLESWLPKSYWSGVNLLWVGFGQEVQQEKAKILRKAIACSRPKDALQLLKRCGLDYNKVAKELGIVDDVERALSQ
jgi:endonuclease III